MRQVDILNHIAGGPVSLPNGVSSISVAGPSYQLTAQSQILRFLFAHSQLVVAGLGSTVTFAIVADAWFAIVLNPNRGATQHFRIPWRPNSSANGSGAMGIAVGSSVTPPVVIGTQTFGWSLENVDARGDDLPNLGGLDIVTPASGIFSVKTSFNYVIAVDSTPPDTLDLDHHFDVLADITDYGAVPFKS